MAEIVAEFFSDLYRPHGAPGTENSVRELRVALDRERVVGKLCTKPALQILPTPVGIAPLGATVNQGIA